MRGSWPARGDTVRFTRNGAEATGTVVHVFGHWYKVRPDGSDLTVQVHVEAVVGFWARHAPKRHMAAMRPVGA